jgi:hypothetical protein
LVSTAVVVIASLWSVLMTNTAGLGLLGVAMGLMFGVATSILPAFMAGLIGAGLHRDGEPLWRSAVVGAGAGIVAGGFFPLLLLLTLGADRVDAMVDSEGGHRALLWCSLAIGAFAGLCSGVAQKRQPTPA